jgi:hypothetical protein
LFTTVEKISEGASIVWKQAMGRRGGLPGNNYSISDAYMAGGKLGHNLTDMY